MKISFKWLLVSHLAAIASGAVYVWAFSPGSELIPIIGAVCAMTCSVAAFWQLLNLKNGCVAADKDDDPWL